MPPAAAKLSRADTSPTMTSSGEPAAKDYYKAWGSHVDDGALLVETSNSLFNLVANF